MMHSPFFIMTARHIRNRCGSCMEVVIADRYYRLIDRFWFTKVIFIAMLLYMEKLKGYCCRCSCYSRPIKSDLRCLGASWSMELSYRRSKFDLFSMGLCDCWVVVRLFYWKTIMEENLSICRNWWISNGSTGCFCIIISYNEE